MKDKVKKFGKKKIVAILIFIVVIMLIIFGGAFLYNKFFYKKSYSEIEEIMLKATKSYMRKNESSLPKNINDSVSLSVKDLVRTGDMKDLQDYVRDSSISCTGNVIVTKISDDYRYVPMLDCGTAYHTTVFMDYIKNHVPVVQSDNGLYQLNDELVFRGENVNNYLKLSGLIYRIVKFSNNRTVIIHSDKVDPTIWDNRYNSDKKSVVGINDYSVSKVRDYLNNLYKSSTFISSADKSLVVAYDLEIGKRSSTAMDKSGSLEKGQILENQYIGLLPLYDFLNVSLDVNCTTSVSPACMNYNYLSKYNYSWWTATADATNTFKVFRIDANASVTSASNSARVRPVLYLSKDALYVSGDGTYEHPYVVR